MASDLSRLTFDPKKHYSGVLFQQGRVLLDADWNEQHDINHHRTTTQTKDVIGACGVPKGSGSFKVSASADGGDLEIAPGWIYIGGLLCKLDPDMVPVTYLNQPYLPKPDTEFFSAPASPLTSPAGNRLEDGFYLVYLDAWQREVNYLDDPLIQEVALGEADTTTRLQTVWQVKLYSVDDNADCETGLSSWETETQPSTGRLNVQTVPVETVTDPCILPPGSGYKRLSNQAYRLEIQNGGDLTTGTCKWSRDNASVETIIEDIDGDFITVESIGKDDILGFAGGQWVEIVDEETTLKSSPRKLIKIVDVTKAIRRIEVDFQGDPVTFDPDAKLKLRRWDQTDGADENGLPLSTEWMDIEDGIQVNFSSGTYLPGNFWVIPARSETANVEWPPYDAALPPEAQAARGINHFFCKLAIVSVTGGQISIEHDCRPQFPPLTDICAEDICYDSRNCSNTNATTVQQALDDLCRARGGSCTYNVTPGPGWENVFDQIQPGRDAHICFQIGTYTLSSPVIVRGKGHIKMTGCGFGSRIRASRSEAALVFENCASVLVRDLHAETGRVGAGSRTREEHLNGTLTFLNCGQVNVQNTSLRCGSGTSRAATCLTIRNDFESLGDVRIQNSEFSIGHFQQGILLVNVQQALVENNVLQVYERPRNLRGPVLLADRKFRAEVKGLLLSDMQLSSAKENSNVRFEYNDRSLHFKTRSSLVRGWEQLLADNPPTGRTREPVNMTGHVNRLANQLITDVDFREGYFEFQDFFQALAQEETSVGTLAITVGGRQTRSVKVLNNSIQGFLQGVHVGLSHENSENEPFNSQNVMITGNNIDILLPFNINKTERYGIFVGNCDSLFIENNNIQLRRVFERNTRTASRRRDHPLIDGIRAWGYFGGRVMITQNHLFSSDGFQINSFDTGIQIQPLNALGNNKRWAVTWNVAPSAGSTIVKGNGVTVLQNTP